MKRLHEQIYNICKDGNVNYIKLSRLSDEIDRSDRREIQRIKDQKELKIKKQFKVLQSKEKTSAELWKSFYETSRMLEACNFLINSITIPAFI